MALPERVKVKLSSEVAGAISITPVVIQELPVRELIELMLGIAGKDDARIRELLLRGTLVSGASRFRWSGWEADAASLREVLATFPDDDPERVFVADKCMRAVLRGGRQAIEIPRAAAAARGMFQRSSFWELLMEVAGGAGLRYAGYSYRDRADRFTGELSLAAAARLRAGSEAVRYSTLRDQIRAGGFTAVELWVER